MAKYNENELVPKFEAAGAGSPAARLYHLCCGEADNRRVGDIWDSREAFNDGKLLGL